MSGIEVAGLRVVLDGAPILRGLDLSVPAGKWVSLIGPNGSGKTTLLRAIGGLVAYSGEVRLGGEPAAAFSRRQVAMRIAMVPQNPVIPPGISVFDYVVMGRTPHIPYLGSESAHDLEVTATVLEQLDLVRFGGRRVDSLSGGELQRALFARALAQEAPILLLDEPTTGLDVGHQQEVLELVDELRARRGLTVLSAMHDLTLAGQFADELVLLDGGVVAASGPAHTVLTGEVIGKHYGATVRVIDDPSAGVVVVPVRHAASPTPAGGEKM